MKKKVAIIDSLGAHGSSHHYYLFGQADGLINAGIDVSIYTNNITKRPDNNIKLYQFYRNIFLSRWKIVSGFRYIIGSIFSIFHAKIKGHQICHYHLFHINILTLIDLLITKMLRMKVVYTIHDVISFDDSKSCLSLDRFIYKRADRIITHNNFSRKAFLSTYNTLSINLDVIPHGNYVPFLDVNTDRTESRDFLGISNDKKVLLFFGIIKKVKGLEILLESLKDIVKKHPDVLLIIAGRVWRNDFSDYQKIIDQHDLSRYCLIRNNFIPQQDVKYYYGASDLVVLPYKRIYQSGVLMMSLSYRKLVLVSDLDPLSEVISDGENGFVFETENINSLSNKLYYVLDNLDNLSLIRETSFNMILTKYGWDRIGSLTRLSYDNIL